MNHNSNTPASGNTGYVYILTNPSFKEDWVKIGKRSRLVDESNGDYIKDEFMLSQKSRIAKNNLFCFINLLFGECSK
jgi:hypothetical protein